MGYNTRFTLTILEGDKTVDEIMKENEDFDGLDYAIDNNGESIETVKWYNHSEDMIKLSKKYPDIVFSLKGDGEEQGDSWYKYFKNGKVQECHAKITYNPYDEKELKDPT